MGLAIRRAVVVRDHGLGRGVGIAGIFAQGTMLHLGKPSVGGLGQNLCFQVMPLQRGRCAVIGAVAEATVGAARGGLGMIPAVRVFIGHGLRQALSKLGGAIVQPVHIFAVAVVRFSHVAVDGAAVLAHGLGEVIAGVVGIHAGGAVQNGALAHAVHHCAVRIFDVAAHSRLAVAGVLRGTERLKAGGLAALAAVKSLTGDNGIDIQLVCAVVGGQPMLGGVMVAVLLRGKSRGDQPHAEHNRQQQGQRPAGEMMISFQFVASYT